MKRFILLFLLILVCAVSVILLKLKLCPITPYDSLKFLVEYDGESQSISCWYDTNNSIHYVFLPAYADLDKIMVICSAHITISDQLYYQGDYLQNITLNTAYESSITNYWGKDSGRSTVVFMQSAKLPALFIETESKTMDYIHKNKKNKESGLAVLVNNNGGLEYQGKLNAIKGRGNNTWNHSAKKPYQFQLTESADLLGMGRSTEWCLISNDHDASQLRNKIVLDFSERIGLQNTPSATFVDLYLNGKYSGLYLLAQKVGVREENGINAACLIELTPRDRISPSDTVINTKAGNYYTVKSQPHMTHEQLNSLHYTLQSFENALYTDNGFNDEGQSYTRFVDMDSWVKKYLVEQIFTNNDAAYASQYFYVDTEVDDRVFYAGPVWDYDLSMGTFFGMYPTITGPEFFKPIGWYYSALYSHPDFAEKVRNGYKSIHPILEEMIDEWLPSYKEFLSHAADMNNIRWPGLLFDDGYHAISDYITRRKNFLYQYLVNEKAYFKVFLYYDADISPYMVSHSNSVMAGEIFNQIPLLTREGYTFSSWVYLGTDIEFDASKPVTKDVALYARWVNAEGEVGEEKASSMISGIKINISLYLAFFFCGLLGIFFLIILWVEFRRNQCHRKLTIQKVKGKKNAFILS